MSIAVDLIHPKESNLKPFVFGISGMVWLLCICSIVGAFYLAFFGVFILMAHAYFLGSVRGTGLRISATQLPELHARVVAAAKKLGLDQVPEVYVLQSQGMLNAFATKLLSRSYIILYSELLDKCHNDTELDFVIAHELGHHAAGHTKWMFFTLPARAVPLLGPAYSRACEYTSDRAGQRGIENLEVSQRALCLLGCGHKASAAANLPDFVEQQKVAGEFWPAVVELGSSHPFLSKRAAALEVWKTNSSNAVLIPPGRPFFSYLLAIFMSPQSFSLLVVLYLVGIMAAIAIPNFMKFKKRAEAAQTQQQQQMRFDDDDTQQPSP